MSAVIPLASRSQSTFPRLVFVRLRARVFPSCNIARAASLRQSTATRDFRSLPVNGATLESSLSSPIAYCCSPVKSSSRGSSSVNEVGESSPYIGPLVQGRGAFRRGCWNVGKAATAHAWHFASSRREEPGEETRLEDPRGEITRNSEEIDKNGYCATSERKNVLFGTDRIIVEGFEEKDDWTCKRKIILEIRTFSFLSSQDSHLPEERQKFYENVKSSSWNPFRLTVKKQKKGARSKRSKRVGKKVEIVDPSALRFLVHRPFDIGPTVAYRAITFVDSIN